MCSLNCSFVSELKGVYEHPFYSSINAREACSNSEHLTATNLMSQLKEVGVVTVVWSVQLLKLNILMSMHIYMKIKVAK
jgi:hypothetical protein